MSIPSLNTERLVLRAPAACDFPVYRDFYGDAEASAFYGGPLTPALAWRKLAYDIGHWSLRGFGMWTVTLRADGSVVGGCGLVWPEGWPRHELTWWIVPAARRHGYAFEASRAAVRWGYDALGFERVETHMDDENAPARTLVEKLGGVVIDRQAFPDGISRNIYALPKV
ncbi:GNAT family N-acetyltransferase [Phenylobacterium sp.]|uniref:GNAT family N-acetyltransferase n=1 Tax=Phenylobacterium sp. TaxID=1871053 RepID=UPI00395ADBA4